jgi:hypothetical protein
MNIQEKRIRLAVCDLSRVMGKALHEVHTGTKKLVSLYSVSDFI